MVARTFKRASGWWQDADGLWHSPSEGPPPVPIPESGSDREDGSQFESNEPPVLGGGPIGPVSGHADQPIQDVGSGDVAEVITDRLIDEKGLTISDAESWVDLGVGDYDEIVAWSMLVDYPNEAEACVAQGYSSADVGPWIKSGIAFDADDALPWIASGYSLIEAAAWRDVSYISAPNEIQVLRDNWASHGFDPSEAVRWVAVDDSPSTAEQWRKSGIALDDAKVFSKAYMDIDDSKLWIEAGFSATVARQFDAEGFDVEDAIASRVRGLTVSAALRRLRDGGFDGEDGEDGEDGDYRPSAINIANSFADDHPQVAARIQSQGVIWWGLVTQHLERLVKLTTEEPAVMAALGEQAGFLPRSKTAIDWASREPNMFQLLASLARGYGTGRLALGTHEQVLQYSTAKEDADQPEHRSAFARTTWSSKRWRRAQRIRRRSRRPFTGSAQRSSTIRHKTPFVPSCLMRVDKDFSWPSQKTLSEQAAEGKAMSVACPCGCGRSIPARSKANGRATRSLSTACPPCPLTCPIFAKGRTAQAPSKWQPSRIGD